MDINIIECLLSAYTFLILWFMIFLLYSINMVRYIDFWMLIITEIQYRKEPHSIVIN